MISDSSCVPVLHIFGATQAVANCFREELRDSDDLILKSDADEQLLIYCPFRDTVKIQSLSIKAPADGTGPATVKIFKNIPGAHPGQWRCFLLCTTKAEKFESKHETQFECLGWPSSRWDDGLR
eukprot:SAG31_NODE_3895_length_3773_cov_21.681818_8_plen_124_part_00